MYTNKTYSTYIQIKQLPYKEIHWDVNWEMAVILSRPQYVTKDQSDIMKSLGISSIKPIVSMIAFINQTSRYANCICAQSVLQRLLLSSCLLSMALSFVFYLQNIQIKQLKVRLLIYILHFSLPCHMSYCVVVVLVVLVVLVVVVVVVILFSTDIQCTYLN